MTDAATTPTTIRAPRGSDALEIEWGDGHVGKYPNEMLRAYCPCAGCQGHSGEIHYRAGGNSVIDDISEVGNYGLCFKWGDAHDSGIYSFRFLRRLCACDQCGPGAAHTRKEPLAR